MDDLIDHLETRIRNFLAQFAQLKESNAILVQNKAQVSREKEMLLNKHKHAISQIENMVSRLKSIEKPQ